MCPAPLKASAIVAAILAGSWLLWLSLSAVEPLPSYGPPPAFTRFSVTPGYSYKPTVLPVTTARPIGTPRSWTWYRPDGCHPALTLSAVCDRLTAGECQGPPTMGGTGSENR